MSKKTAPSKASGSVQNTEMLLLSRAGAENVKSMLGFMGHGMKIGTGNTVAVEFKQWSWLPGTPMVRIVFDHGIDILLHEDDIRGNFTIRPKA